MNNINFRIPDVSFISKARAPELPEKKMTITPDIAVEVVSPSESHRDILDKVELYLQAGTQRVWVFDPEYRDVNIWRSSPDGGMQVHKLTENDTLDDADILPGFSLPLKKVFID